MIALISQAKPKPFLLPILSEAVNVCADDLHSAQKLADSFQLISKGTQLENSVCLLQNSQAGSACGKHPHCGAKTPKLFHRAKPNLNSFCLLHKSNAGKPCTSNAHSSMTTQKIVHHVQLDQRHCNNAHILAQRFPSQLTATIEQTHSR